MDSLLSLASMASLSLSRTSASMPLLLLPPFAAVVEALPSSQASWRHHFMKEKDSTERLAFGDYLDVPGSKVFQGQKLWKLSCVAWYQGWRSWALRGTLRISVYLGAQEVRCKDEKKTYHLKRYHAVMTLLHLNSRELITPINHTITEKNMTPMMLARLSTKPCPRQNTQGVQASRVTHSGDGPGHCFRFWLFWLHFHRMLQDLEKCSRLVANKQCHWQQENHQIMNQWCFRCFFGNKIWCTGFFCGGSRCLPHSSFTLQPRHMLPHASAWHIAISCRWWPLRWSRPARAAAAQPNVATFRLGGHGIQDLTMPTVGQTWCGWWFNTKKRLTADGGNPGKTSWGW